MFWSNPSTFFIQATVPRTAPEALILRPLASSLPTAGRPRSTSNGFVWDIYTEIHRWEGIILRSSQSKVSMDLSHHSVYGYKPKYLCLSISVHIKIILRSYLSHQHGGKPQLGWSLLCPCDFPKTNATRPWPCDVIRISISAQQDVQCKMMCVVKKRINKDQILDWKSSDCGPLATAPRCLAGYFEYHLAIIYIYIYHKPKLL